MTQDKNQEIVELFFQQQALNEELTQAIRQYVHFKGYPFISKFYANKAKKLIAEHEKVLEKIAKAQPPIGAEVEVLR